VGQQSSASASRLLGQDVFEVLAAQVVGGEWQLETQTTAVWSAHVRSGSVLRECPSRVQVHQLWW